MDSQVIAAVDYQRERWRNQLGWTRQIFRSGGEQDWGWRLSIAEIDDDAAFSRFPGADRELILLSGNGLHLRFDDGEVAALAPPHERHRFAGERAVRGELTDGPVRVFNLMWQRDRFSTRLWHRPLVGSMVVFAEPGEVWMVHLLAGQLRFGDRDPLPDMQGGDTALLRADGDGRVRYALEGGGEALLARISSR